MEKLTDTDLLDFLQHMLDKRSYTGKCIFRWSTTGRGWRLHETSEDGANSSVRQALIDAYYEEILGVFGEEDKVG